MIAGIFLLLLLLASPARAADAPSVIRDEEIEQALKTMCTPVFRQAGVSPQSVKFILIEDNELNAFVAGGQNIFIHTGLLLSTENPEEITGVVAHETGHIALGHLLRLQEEMKNMSFESILANILGIATVIATGRADAGMAVSAAGQNVAMSSLLSHSRTQEGSADAAGVKFLRGAQLPMTGLLSFMEKLKGQELLPETEQSQYIRTHPLTQDRIDFLENAAAQKYPSVVPKEWYTLHKRLKAKLLGFLFPVRALQDRSDTTEARYGRAIAYYRQGKLDKSLALLDPLIAQEPANPYFYELKGQMLLEYGHVADSLPAYAQAARYAPDSGLIRTAYGHALLEEGRTQEAVKQFTLSLRNEDRAPDTHHFLAVAYGRLGDEGQSRLHLAEEALLQNNLDYAQTEASLALKKLPSHSPNWLRAQDILDFTARTLKKKH